MFCFDSVFQPEKYPETATDPLNGCGILQILVSGLEYILRFPAKRLVKIRF